jgi:hypothetical protein
MFLCLGFVQDTAHRGSADVKTAGDFGFAEASTAEFPDLIGVQGGREGTAQAFAVLPGMGKSSSNALAQNFALELGEDRQ